MITVFTGTTEKASFPPDFKKVMESRSKEKSEAKWQEQRHRGSKQGHSRQKVVPLKSVAGAGLVEEL